MNRILRKTLPLLAMLSAAAGRAASGRADPLQGPFDRIASPSAISRSSLSLGYGTRTNPVAGRYDIPLFVIPHVSYYGKRFFLESLEPGVTLYESDAHTFNLIATPGFDRVFFSRKDLQNVIVPLAAVAPPGVRPERAAGRRRSRSAAATPRTSPDRNGCSATAISSGR